MHRSLDTLSLGGACLQSRDAEPYSRSVAIALHDVSPATWPMCDQLLTLIESFGTDIPITLLVVPHMHRRVAIDESTEGRERIDDLLARGSEIALHGLWHLDEGGSSPTFGAAIARRVLTDGEAEFAAVDAAGARQRIEKGLALLHRCGWQAAGFVPPAWQISASAASVLTEFPFGYTTSFGTITQLATGRRWNVPCLGLSARSALRRTVSIAWTRLCFVRLEAASTLRLALHPADACHSSTLETWRSVLESVLRDRRPLTKSALCRELLSRDADRTSCFNKSVTKDRGKT